MEKGKPISQTASTAIIADILSSIPPQGNLDRIVEGTRQALADSGCSINLPGSFEEYMRRLLLGRI